MTQSYYYRPGQQSQLNATTIFALIVHGLIVFGISIAYSPAISDNQQMEVALSVAKSDEAPEQADFIAETNQIGSGTLDEAKQLTQTSQAQYRDVEVKESSEVFVPQLASGEFVQPEHSFITTTGDSTHSVPLREIDFLRYQKIKNNVGTSEYLAMLDLSISSMEAKVADAHQAETKRPRSLILDSTSTLAAEDASYIRAWRDRVEASGNQNYPAQAREQGLYGNVRLLVKILANGEVDDIVLMEASGSPILDEAAIQSIWHASPFEPFGAELAAKYDQIEIVRTWQFQKNRISTAN